MEKKGESEEGSERNIVLLEGRDGGWRRRGKG